jgi:hypothetical protein
MDKLAVVLLSDMKDPTKVETSMRFTLLAKTDGSLAAVRFFFLGPDVQVPGQLKEQPELRQLMGELLDSGLTTVACAFDARQLKQEGHLWPARIESHSIGGELVGSVRDGYQIVTFLRGGRGTEGRQQLQPGLSDPGFNVRQVPWVRRCQISGLSVGPSRHR